MGDEEPQHPSLRAGAAPSGLEHWVEVSAAPLGGVWASRAPGQGVVLARRIPRGNEVDDTVAARIVAAANLAARIEDPAVIAPRRGIVTEDEVTVTSRYVEAEFLRDLQRGAVLGRTRIDFGVALRIARDALAALREARDHWRSLGGGRNDGTSFHGGAGPYTFCVTRAGETLLTDPVVGATLAAIRGFEENPGLMSYRSPEQLAGAAGERTDVFLVGIVLWEMIANRPLFATPSLFRARGPVRDPWDEWPSVAPIASKVKTALREPLRIVAPRSLVPEGVVALLDHMLARRPEDRPATFEAAVAEIDALGAVVATTEEVGGMVKEIAGEVLEKRLATIMSQDWPSEPVEVELPAGDRATRPGPFVLDVKPVVILGVDDVATDPPGDAKEDQADAARRSDAVRSDRPLAPSPAEASKTSPPDPRPPAASPGEAESRGGIGLAAVVSAAVAAIAVAVVAFAITRSPATSREQEAADDPRPDAGASGAEADAGSATMAVGRVAAPGADYVGRDVAPGTDYVGRPMPARRRGDPKKRFLLEDDAGRWWDWRVGKWSDVRLDAGDDPGEIERRVRE